MVFLDLLKINKSVLYRGIRNGLLIQKLNHKRKLKDSTKQKLSISRKKYLEYNKNNHNWSKYNNESKPENDFYNYENPTNQRYGYILGRFD